MEDSASNLKINIWRYYKHFITFSSVSLLAGDMC